MRLFAELGSTMKLPRSGRGRLWLEVIELADQERPPMIRIPEYLERRGVASGGAVDSIRTLMAAIDRDPDRASSTATAYRAAHARAWRR